MRVDFDDQIFSAQAVGGVSRYFAELMREYRSNTDLGVQLVASPIWTQNAHLLGVGLGRRLPRPLGNHRRITGPINRQLRRAGSPDILHHTFYDRRYLDRHRDVPFRVVTIYDMIPERLPELFSQSNPHADKRSFVDAADLILCISEATKADLIDLYGLPDAPIVVTPLGVDGRFSPGAKRPLSLPDRYILYVGSRNSYKDFDVLASAFAKADLPGNVMLMVVGGSDVTVAEQRVLESLGIASRVRRVGLDDEGLAGAYAHAICFVFPSRHEGFGLPTLEAMASGCPTILARSSAHVEVGGDAALYFPPGDHDDLAGEISRLVADEELQAQRRVAGLEQAARFSWRNTATSTASAYRRVRALSTS